MMTGTKESSHTRASLLEKRREIRSRIYRTHTPCRLPAVPKANSCVQNDAPASAGPLTIHKIATETARYFRISPPAGLVSHNRHRRYVRARQIAFYLARVLTERSYPVIGRYMGGFDHTTVIHGHRKIARILETCAETRTDVETLILRLCPDKQTGGRVADEQRYPPAG